MNFCKVDPGCLGAGEPNQADEMGFFFVLLLKGGGDYYGTGLLEPCWMVTEKIIVPWLSSVKFHDSLHGRLLGRGTGMARIKAKLHQSLA